MAWITFHGSPALTTCARAIREGVQGLGVEIRAGVHTGEIELRGDEVTGLAVHIGARVVALAAPSEILVSRTVKDLVVGSGIDFGDPDTWQLYAVAG
jgi:class 3 adenylate cyclase